MTKQDGRGGEAGSAERTRLRGGEAFRCESVAGARATGAAVPSGSATGDGEAGDGVEGDGVADWCAGFPGRQIVGRAVGAAVPATSRLRCRALVGASSSSRLTHFLLSLWTRALRNI